MRVLHELVYHRHGRNAETREVTRNAPADVMGYLPIYKEQTAFPKSIVGKKKKKPPHREPWCLETLWLDY